MSAWGRAYISTYGLASGTTAGLSTYVRTQPAFERHRWPHTVFLKQGNSATGLKQGNSATGLRQGSEWPHTVFLKHRWPHPVFLKHIYGLAGGTTAGPSTYVRSQPATGGPKPLLWNSLGASRRTLEWTPHPESCYMARAPSGMAACTYVRTYVRRKSFGGSRVQQVGLERCHMIMGGSGGLTGVTAVGPYSAGFLV